MNHLKSYDIIYQNFFFELIYLQRLFDMDSLPNSVEELKKMVLEQQSVIEQQKMLLDDLHWKHNELKMKYKDLKSKYDDVHNEYVTVYDQYLYLIRNRPMDTYYQLCFAMSYITGEDDTDSIYRKIYDLRLYAWLLDDVKGYLTSIMKKGSYVIPNTINWEFNGVSYRMHYDVTNNCFYVDKYSGNKKIHGGWINEVDILPILFSFFRSIIQPERNDETIETYYLYHYVLNRLEEYIDEDNGRQYIQYYDVSDGDYLVFKCNVREGITYIIPITFDVMRQMLLVYMSILDQRG